MSVYFVPANPSSGEGGTYLRYPRYSHFTSRPVTWTWGFSAGHGLTTFPAIRLLIDGVPVTDFVQPATNEYVFTFDPGDGRFVTEFEGTTFEVLNQAFSVRTGSPLPDGDCWATPTRLERDYGLAKNASVKIPYGLTATNFPYKERIAEPYTQVLAANKLWGRHMVTHTHGAMIRRWVRLPDGTLNIEPSQKYAFWEAKGRYSPDDLRPPIQHLRDGNRGVGTLGYIYKIIISPVDSGFYYTEVNGRIGFTRFDGNISSFAGWRLKDLKMHSEVLRQTPVVDRDAYDLSWENAGDWSRVPDPKAFNEVWGFDGIGEPGGGLHEFWIADTLNNRVLYLNHYTAHSSNYRLAQYPPAGYTPPSSPTGQSQIVKFEDASEPWDCSITEIDGVKWLYFSEYRGNAISRRRLDGTGFKETVIKCSIDPTDQQLGVPAPYHSPPHRLWGSNTPQDQIRANFKIDGPPGVATCVHPQAIAFDSSGRLTWVEPYTNLLRRFENGQVVTIAELTKPADTWNLAIDTEGTCGPKDDIFVKGWWLTDFRYSVDGVKRGGIINGVQSQQILNGPAEWCRIPGYGWGLAVRHGRIILQGSAGGWQFIEYTKKQPTDPNIDFARVVTFANNHWNLGSTLALTHGPWGQGELGLPMMEELGSWDDDTLRAFFTSHGIADTEEGIYFVRANTVDFDYSGVEPPVSIQVPSALSVEVQET